jgi:2-dehydro-3-deoxyphosphogluconate aldolase/(4S)-4-hydroxy-2-oxoglutarate aldolase
LKTIELCQRYGKPVIPGALTPTEILTAWEAGADMVKVFPADSMGPGYIKAVLAPLPQIRLVPTGGISADNAAQYIKAGATALGVGGKLVDKSACAEGNWTASPGSQRLMAAWLRDRHGSHKPAWKRPCRSVLIATRSFEAHPRNPGTCWQRLV